MSPWFPPRLGRESMCPTSAIGARATSCSFIGRRTFVATLSRRLKRPVSARSPERPESGPTRPCTSVVGCWSTRTSALASRSSLFGIAARTERSGCAGWRILTRREGAFCLARHPRCSCRTPEANASAILCNGYTKSCAAFTRVDCHRTRACSRCSALCKPGLDTAVQARASVEHTQDGR